LIQSFLKSSIPIFKITFQLAIFLNSCNFYEENAEKIAEKIAPKNKILIPIRIIIQRRAAFEKFALTGLVSLLKAHTSNKMIFTKGIKRRRKIINQSPTEGI
jgi:hypothetical protein